MILDDLRGAIPFQAHVFALTDPVTRVATSPHADVPGLPWPRLPELIRCRYLTPINRWTTLLDTGGGARSLLAATEGEPERSLLWRDVQRDLGVIDTASLAFGDRYGCWGFLELLRISSPPFSATELATLSGLAATITTGLRTALGRTFVAPERMDVFARAHALSARESEVLALLAADLDSRCMATELVLSEHTVNDHVKAILAKCGVPTRQTLLSLVLGIA